MFNRLNEKGSLHVIAIVVLFVCLVGVWFLYHSWQNDQLSQDAKQIVSEYHDLGNKIVEKMKRSTTHR